MSNTDAAQDRVKLTIPLGEGFNDYEANFRRYFKSSDFILVKYNVPFSLNVEEQKKGVAVVTKDGKEGEEKVGDVLRATTCFSSAFAAGGAASDIMAFAGNVKWRKGVFEAIGAPWQQVVDALISNTPEKTSDVMLVFERATPDADE
eukprot:CAMPEP_0182427928 /NCGR_PEP_ID=MMETSP1167-20130531/20861_1 /TAXON_ID=2988 /ORGANISM="Mallomonas Sp, Strain CCMP3275" /LENGTH=146 /DNA_ID=CAMNT_0024610517 /DNA_START=128 /DNA_END=568 /DNA_ORIENTATION=+